MDDLDAIAASHYPANEPGAAILVTKNGEVLLRKGYGMADLEQGIPLTPEMVFRIGSVTKQFTAAAILLLEQEGKLSVTDDLRKYLPEYPTHGKVITLEHLLTHTSGIRSYTDMKVFGEKLRSDLSVEEVIALFQNEPLGFEPGTKYAYNNSGYFLLGAVIEKVSGKSYETYLREKIFEPLGMSQTYYGSATRVLPKRAQGYDALDGEFQNAEYLSMTLPYAAGSLLSTVDDLAKWDRALEGTVLLRRSSLEKWWNPFALPNGESAHYGYGWGLSEYEGRRVVSHGGGINGFTCQLLRIPEERLFVVVLTNRNDEKSNPGLVARKLAAAAMGSAIDDTEAPSPDPAKLAAHEGLYRTAAGVRYLVSRGKDHLQLRRYGDEHPDGGRTRNPGPNERLNRLPGKLLPMASGAFRIEDSLTRVSFENRALVVEDWGRLERAERSDEPFDDASRVLASVEKLLEAITARDGEAIHSVLDGEARLVQTESREGSPRLRPFSAEEFVSRIVAHRGPAMRETIDHPEVRVSDNLATVWAPYQFYLGDRLTHCGEDAFQLGKTDIGWPGWKILALADTRKSDCPAGR
jgi:CubicO group peptidase (beta-lactamase class C family)